MTPTTAEKHEHNTTTTETQPKQPTSAPTANGSKPSTPSVPRTFVPPTGSTGANYPNSFSAYNPETKRVEHVCLGIIDMFMYYHEGRALFSYWRSITENAEEISTVEPVLYGERFTKWMGANVFAEGAEETSVEKK
ncbi:hypothetical protein M1146_04465 [Patescibacteria group bacterium]|nr:hypothetical protein [Patescibacteria group bacterium]